MQGRPQRPSAAAARRAMQDKINEQEIELQCLKGMKSILDVSWHTLTRLSVVDLKKAHAAKRVLEQQAAMAHCHAPNTFGTVNMECTVDSRLSWSEQ